MMQNIRHAIVHLRLPFSFFLMPVFLFALSQGEHILLWPTVLLFAVLHLLAYPSSNAYNSYMDQDTGSIGGLEAPPKVPSIVFPITLGLDFLALALTVFYLPFGTFLLLLAYILASRAYSYRGIRLKKYPIVGFLTVAIFQGPVVYWMSVWAMEGQAPEWSLAAALCSAISLLLIGAGYPLTQVYQHEQDRADGVHTLSMMLGIRGTFLFSGTLYAVLGGLLAWYFAGVKSDWPSLGLFALCSAPVMCYFAYWMRACFADASQANFKHTMRSNLIGAFAINLFFLLLILIR
jgi:1,4-dihydroxy-2-naphthoate octaprenyltransferase